MLELDKTGFWKNREVPTKSLAKTAQLFDEMGGKTVVEIGTGLHGELAGNSIHHWIKTKAERIVVVDIKKKLLKQVENLDPRIKTLHQSAESFSETYMGVISLLYMDFPVKDLEGEIRGTQRSQIYHKVYQEIKRYLLSPCMILIDDTDHVHPWKDTLLVPAARADGFKVEWIGRQTLLSKCGGI